MKLNKEELLVGFIYGASIFPVLSYKAIIPAVLCSILWAMGGSEDSSKLFRRIGVPLVMAGSLSFVNKMLILLAIPYYAIVSIGYGIPDNTDKGSKLGKFFVMFLPVQAANWATRFSIYALLNIVTIITLSLVR